MSIKLALPKVSSLKPRIVVVGVGGAGGNAINNMIASGLDGVEFVAANTDAQALEASSAEVRIQLGVNLTEGLGAGSKPEIGEAAAEEALEEIRARVASAHMVFVAAGMGGGTGTGAAAVIARAAKEEGVLTVGIVTKPFQFEGARRLRMAEAGIEELKKFVDTLIVIPNQNLFRIANEKTTFAEAFILADQVLYSGIACIVDLIVKDGLINLDFADVRTIMSGMGTAMMGTGEGSGDRRAVMAAEEAISNPLLDDITLSGARGLLLSITGGRDLTLYEVDEAASRVRQEVDPEANIIVGATFDESLGDRVRVSIVASGMNRAAALAGAASSEAWVRDRLGLSPAASRDAVSPPPRQPEAFEVRGEAPVAPLHSARAQPVFEPTVPPAPRSQPAPPVGATSAAAAQRAEAAEAAEAQAQEEDLRRRLIGALAYDSEPTTSDGDGDADPGYAEGFAPAGEPWQSVGDVTIEEGPPQLHDLGLEMPSAPAAPAQPPVADRAPASTFAPAAPAEIRRPQRRLPEIDDFPAVGQREYRARAGDATTSSERALPLAPPLLGPLQTQPGNAATRPPQGPPPLAQGASPRAAATHPSANHLAANHAAGPHATATHPSAAPSSGGQAGAGMPQRAARGQQPQPGTPAPSQRRPGLFERLTGRRAAEETQGPADSEAELPVFFNRGQK